MREGCDTTFKGVCEGEDLRVWESWLGGGWWVCWLRVGPKDSGLRCLSMFDAGESSRLNDCVYPFSYLTCGCNGCNAT